MMINHLGRTIVVFLTINETPKSIRNEVNNMKKIIWPGRTKLENSSSFATLVLDVILYIPRLIMKLF
ncbi:hypothetical protein DP091_24795 [Paenibacillus sp. MDMC362]|nr:hypothetical protein DP091_24795 [Paenibacillus sp. MDMC362]